MCEQIPELTPEERQEKIDYVVQIVKRDCIESVREAILDYEMSGYVDESRSGLLDSIQGMLENGCKSINTMTVEELADELDIQELRDLFEESDDESEG